MKTKEANRHSRNLKKAYPTGDFVIVAKFGDHVFHRLACSLLNEVGQVHTQEGRQIKIPV